MSSGTIGSVNIYYGCGTDYACWAEIDQGDNRLDQYGCFPPNGSKQERKSAPNAADSFCSAIDFNVGFKPSKESICSKIPDEIDPCVMQNMIALAETVSIDVEAYTRVDMFAGADGSVYLKEFSTNYLNGQRHCSAKLHADNGNCVDSCSWVAFGRIRDYGMTLIPPLAVLGAHSSPTTLSPTPLPTLPPTLQPGGSPTPNPSNIKTAYLIYRVVFPREPILNIASALTRFVQTNHEMTQIGYLDTKRP